MTGIDCPGGELSTLEPGPYTFRYLDASGALLHEVSFKVDFDAEGAELERAPFVLTIPYVDGTARILVTYDGQELAQKLGNARAQRSASLAQRRREAFPAKSQSDMVG